MFRNMKIQTRLLLMMGMVMLLGVVIVGWSLVTIIRLDGLSSEMLRLDTEGSQALDAGNTATRLALSDLSSSFDYTPERINAHAVERARLAQYIAEARLRSSYPQVDEHLQAMEAALPLVDANWALFYPSTLVFEVPADFDWVTVDGGLRETADLMYDVRERTDMIYEFVRVDLDQVQQDADGVYLWSLLVGAAALLLFLLLSLIAALTITNQINLPLVRLIDAARDVEQGKFNPESLKSLTSRNDELGRIARSMTEMAQHVDERRAALEAEAAELRAKLA